MAQTDSEDWLAAHQASYVIDRVGARFGIAGAVRKEYSVGLQCQNVFGCRLRRDYCDFAAFSTQLSQNILLDAKVVGDYVEALRLIFHAHDFVGKMRAFAVLPDIGVVGGNDLRQILAIHLGDRTSLGYQFVRILDRKSTRL